MESNKIGDFIKSRDLNANDNNFNQTYNKIMDSKIDENKNGSSKTPVKHKTSKKHDQNTEKTHKAINDEKTDQPETQEKIPEASGFIITAGIDNTLKRVFTGKNSKSLNCNYEVSNEIKLNPDVGILCIELSKDNKTLFLGDEGGHLKQYKFAHFSLTHDYKKVHNGSIWCMSFTPNDEKYLFTADSEGTINQIDIANKV